MTTDNKTGIWWRYLLLLVIIVFARPATYFASQALRGHPVDPNYFWTEWSPFGLFGGRLYNGKGGANWKIGEAKANILNADELRKLSEVRQFALELVNRDRNINTLGSIVTDPVLNDAAQRHAEDMARRNYFDHKSPEGKTPRDRFINAGGSQYNGVGENIAFRGITNSLGLTYGVAEELQRGWMYSNGHRENLLTPEYKKFGYGIAVSPDGRLYAVQMFSN
ncbi:hypothetical protein CAL7716_012650 [Calothrix sp. PCC 7716]|nr:hypothetical protein CAL7716_012650 [Calothrix sp. PCC 7716]